MSVSEILTPSVGRRFPFVSWACAFSPFFLLFCFFTLGIHIRLGLGHWPTPMLEDYHTRAFDIHAAIFGIVVTCAFYAAAPVWFVCLFFRALRPSWPRAICSQLAICASGWLIIAAVYRFDPTTFTAWVLD